MLTKYKNKCELLLEDILSCNLGLEKENLWNTKSLERVLKLTPNEMAEIITKLNFYHSFFIKMKKQKLSVETDFFTLLKLACNISNYTVDFTKLPSDTSPEFTFHAYLPTGNCLFASPNFIKQIKYDLLTLLAVPWFELFSRKHTQDVEVFLSITKGYLSKETVEPKLINDIPDNILTLEKLEGKPDLFSRGYFYAALFDDSDQFAATLVVSTHLEIKK